jgi:hypothetical protein
MSKPPILRNRWFSFCKIKRYKPKQIKNKIFIFIFKNKQKCIIIKTEVNKHIYIQTEESEWLRIFGLLKKLHKLQKG